MDRANPDRPELNRGRTELDRGGPLSHIRVIDLTRVRAGPTAVRQLADWGADVIKVEAPASAGGDGGLGGPRHGPDFQNLHRGKRSLTLNLKAPRGLAILKELIKSADVFAENYRPDVKHRLGVNYESLAAINPRLVYGSISGFGQTGPYADRPGVDQIAQGLGGLMSVTGAPGEGPMRVGIPVADLTSGLHLALGILVALIERDKSGKGQWVQSSLLEAQISMMDFQASRYTIAGEVPGQMGNEHPTAVPMGVFETADGHINIAPAGERAYEGFCAVLGRPDFLEHPDFATAGARYKNRPKVIEAITAETRKRASADLIEAFNEAGVPCGPIYTIDQTFADPQVKHMAMARTVDHKALGPLDIIRSGVDMSRTPAIYDLASPEAGEHTDDVLAGIGLKPDEIEKLRRDDII
jgi:formyl-CoA transferase